MILVLNVQQGKLVWGGIRQLLSRKGDQNSLILPNHYRNLKNLDGNRDINFQKDMFAASLIIMKLHLGWVKILLMCDLPICVPS